jgi:hypothetical protein
MIYVYIYYECGTDLKDLICVDKETDNNGV